MNSFLMGDASLKWKIHIKSFSSSLIFFFFFLFQFNWMYFFNLYCGSRFACYFQWLPWALKKPHLCHYFPLQYQDGNMMFFSVLEVRTPVIILQTIYMLLWNKRALLLLEMRKTLREENLYHQSSWKQLKNQGLQLFPLKKLCIFYLVFRWTCKYN